MGIQKYGIKVGIHDQISGFSWVDIAVRNAKSEFQLGLGFFWNAICLNDTSNTGAALLNPPVLPSVMPLEGLE